MLLNMHIKNIALIDEIDIGFEDRLNILTGETGAGKSIIIGSLGIGLGGRFQKELLRDETRDGVVELLFSVDNEKIRKELEEIDIFLEEENELLISRRLNPAGRCVNKINDNTVTTSKLKETAAILIDLHAQHEQQTLLKASKHLAILDQFGGREIEEKKEEVSKLFYIYTDLKEKLSAESMDEAEKNKKIDFLQYQINEISSAKLKVGEDEELEKLYKKAINSKELLVMTDEVYRMTGDDRSASEMIGHAVMQMKRMADLDEELLPLYDTLLDVDSMLSDFNRELSDYRNHMEFDEEEFHRIDERLNLIHSLKLKYGNEISDILDNAQAFEEEYNKLCSFEEYIENLKNEFEQIKMKLTCASDALSEARKVMSEKLCHLIKEALQELNFASVEFDMEFEKKESFGANGNDDAYFVISTNVGEKLRPLYDVASGGELSRVMLAIKSCLAFEDDTPTLIFDEIDVGISGRTAQKVAEKLSVIGQKHQVICITHLPQIAAMADTHYLIEKNVENNKTISNIKKLLRKEEIDEIARLLGGAEITEATIFSAEEMKGLADRTKIY